MQEGGVAASARPLALNLAAMGDFDHHDGDARVLDAADRAVVADAVAPEAGPTADHRLAEGARVAVALQVALQGADDPHGGGSVDLLELLLRAGLVFNRPDRAHAASPR